MSGDSKLKKPVGARFLSRGNYVRVLRASMRLDPSTRLPAILSVGQYRRLVAALAGPNLLQKYRRTRAKRQFQLQAQNYRKNVDINARLNELEICGRRVPSELLGSAQIDDTQFEYQGKLLLELRKGHYSTENLYSHMDGEGDVLWATLNNLLIIREMRKIRTRPAARSRGKATSIIFDARCLQDVGLRDRGIGHFAFKALLQIRKEVSDSRILFITDSKLPRLAPHILGDGTEISTTKYLDFDTVALMFQPSPMTASPEPLLDAIRGNVPCAAIVYDFIPARFPHIYLQNTLSRTQYLACLRTLERYDALLPISSSVSEEISYWLPNFSGKEFVCWPMEIFQGIELAHELHLRTEEQNFTIVSGNEPRKNIYGALRLLAKFRGDINVIGMSSNSDVVLEMGLAVGLDLERIRILPRVSESIKNEILRGTSAVIVLSFAEGLSLPVIEGVLAGAPVLASEIPPHIELLGDGPWIADPHSPAKLEKALNHILSRPREVAEAQLTHLRSATLESLECQVSSLIREYSATELEKPADTVAPQSITRSVYIAPGLSRKPTVGVATPLLPQPTGVADYSAATLPALAEICDLTVYGTECADPKLGNYFKPIGRASVEGVQHDFLLTVMGNSYFHLPVYQFLDRFGGQALCHDSAMLDFFDELYGLQASNNMQNRGGETHISTLYDSQGTLPNLNFTDLAGKSDGLIFHSEPVADRVRREALTKTAHVPFIPLRRPSGDWNREHSMQKARSALRKREHSLSIVSVGYLSEARKLTTTLVEACLWLRQWGYDVDLTFAGGGSADQVQALYRNLDPRDRGWLQVTGYLQESVMMQYLQSADLFVQLRLGDVQMMSGPVFDAAAFGVPGVVTDNLSDNHSLPSYIVSAGNAPTPYTLARVMESKLNQPTASDSIDEEMFEFLKLRSPSNYANALINSLFTLGV